MRTRAVSWALLLGLVALAITTARTYARADREVRAGLRICDSEHMQILTTLDGSTVMGRIVEIGTDEIQFETDVGKLTIPISKIKQIKEAAASSIVNGRYWFPNPNATRLYFAPTGRTLGRGEGYFADYYVFFPMVAYGVRDYLTIGGGMSLVPGIKVYQQVFYFTPKVRLVSTGRYGVCAGALVVKLPDFDDEDWEAPLVGILYGVGTVGGPDRSFTAGLGYGFVDSDFADKPMVVLGGERRLTRRLAFVTENWIFPGVDQPLVSYGVRFFGEGLSVDLGLINVLGEGFLFPGIPYIDFVYNFYVRTR